MATNSTQAIFVDNEGNPLQVHVDISVPSRHRTIRSLKSMGAVMAEPALSHILLVEPDATAAIDNYGTQNGPVVLDYGWVSNSIAKGKASLSAEDWGGFRLFSQDTGDEAEAEVDDGNTAQKQNSLPTPRQTPVANGVSASASCPTPRTENPAPTTPADNSHPPLTPNMQFGTQTNIPMAFPYNIPTTPQPLWGLSQPPQQTPKDGFTNMTVPNYMLDTFKEVLYRIQQQAASQSPQGGQYNPSALSPTQYARPDPTAPHNDILPPSVKRRKSDSSFPGPSSTPNRIVDTGERPRKHRRTRSVSPESDYASSSDESDSESSSRPIFSDENYEPLTFVVQVDLKQRKDIVSAIRANGGLISGDLNEAHYVVLNPHSNCYADLSKTSRELDIPAVQANFILDSVKEGELLDADDYSFDGVKYKHKRGRPYKSMEKEPAKVEKRKKKKEKKKGKEKRRHSSPQHMHSRAMNRTTTHQAQSSPSKPKPSGGPSQEVDLALIQTLPNPPQKVVAYSLGRNRYTEEEYDYISDVLPLILRYNPEVTIGNLAAIMTYQMPQHTFLSWSAQLGKWKDRVEEMRKKIMITLRKESRSTHGSTPSNIANNAVNQETRNEPSGSRVSLPVESPAAHSASEAPSDVGRNPDIRQTKEFQAITQFLAGGGADDKTDEEAYNNLSALHPYWTGVQWKAYWNANGAVLSAEVNRLMQENGMAATPKVEPAQD
ncbi:DNA-binding protein RAP1 [Abortiporus biennis]